MTRPHKVINLIAVPLPACSFSEGWPDAPHRVLRSSVEALEGETAEVVARTGEIEIPRASTDPPARTTVGRIAAMALYAGESVGSVRRVQPAAEIVEELVGEAERGLHAATGAG